MPALARLLVGSLFPPNVILDVSVCRGEVVPGIVAAPMIRLSLSWQGKASECLSVLHQK